jgi:hypothetical protein
VHVRFHVEFVIETIRQFLLTNGLKLYLSQLSVERLSSMKKYVFGLGTAQVI